MATPSESPAASVPPVVATDKVAASAALKTAAPVEKATAPVEKAADQAAAKSARWHDEWVTKLAGDGSELRSVIGLFGYLGQSPEPGRVRLYFDANLFHAIEFDLHAIVHRLAAPREFSALGGSFVWLSSEGWAHATPLWRQI